jgi:hypothetical protein
MGIIIITTTTIIIIISSFYSSVGRTARVKFRHLVVCC